jgi:Domain of unknown function (DUF4836)
MNKYFKIFLIFLGVSIIASSSYFLFRSNSGTELVSHVPDNASVAVQIKISQLGRFLEADKKEIAKLKFLNNTTLIRNHPGLKALFQMIKSPKVSGIDFTYPAVFFSESLLRGNASGLLVKLVNKKAFEEMVIKSMPSGNEKGEQNHVQYAEFDAGIYLAWNNEIALLSHQPTEGKTYFENIVNKKKQIAEKNEIFQKITRGKGFLTGIILVDEISNTNALKPEPEAGLFQVKNPFPKGTAFQFELFVEKQEIKCLVTAISKQKSKLHELNFFKQTGNFRTYNSALFSAQNPILTFSMSAEPEKFFHFLRKLIPQVDVPEIEKEFNNLWNGDLVLGISLNPHLQPIPIQKYSFNNNPFEIILHLGTKKSAKSLMDEYNGEFKNPDGSYFLPYLNLNVVVKDKDVILTNRAGTSKDLAIGHFKDLEKTEKFASVHTNAPLFMSLFAPSITGNSVFYGPELLWLQNLLKDADGNPVLWMDGSKLIAQIRFKSQNHSLFLNLLMAFDDFLDVQLYKSTKPVPNLLPKIDVFEPGLIMPLE